MQATVNEIEFTDDDIVDIDSWIPAGEYNPHNVHPWLLHDNGFVLCVVFASNLQDALDAAVDANKLDHFLVDDAQLAEYGPDEEGITRLGNASEPFDIESVSFVELKNPPRSFVAQFVAE